MSSITIWTDTSCEEQKKKEDDFLMTAMVGDRVIYQGPNQMDTNWYTVIEIDSKKQLQWTPLPSNYYD